MAALPGNNVQLWMQASVTLLAGQDEAEKLSGATATVVLARSDKIVVANVGDSRAVLSRRCAVHNATHHSPTGISA